LGWSALPSTLAGFPHAATAVAPPHRIWPISCHPFRRAGTDAIVAAQPIVRLILGITLLLLGLGSLLCSVDGTVGNSVAHAPVGQWVRTTYGWERTNTWQAMGSYQPELHPLVVAAGQGLVSILALVAFRREDSGPTRPQTGQ